MTPSPELDFVAGVAAVHGGVFFRVDGCAHVRAEVCGERCTLFLSEAAWGELVRQAELLDVEEFGTKSRDFIYELPLRRAYVLHRGETQIVVATRGHVLLALRHPLPD